MAKPNKAYWSIFSMLRRMYENSPSPSYSAENQVGAECGVGLKQPSDGR